MDQVSPDLLLLIFKKLSSTEMVSVMRVERKWLQIIDENRALWRELVLPSKKKGWGLQALQLFDHKSNSTLKRVSMVVAKEVDSDSFVETLEKSKDTLQVLKIKGKSWDREVEEAIEENIWKFPHLVDCRLTGPLTSEYKLSLQLKKRIEDQEDDEGSSLRVLWISDSKTLLKSHLYLLDSLVSLVLDTVSYGSVGIRRILERLSRTLKHLEISFEMGEGPRVPNLNFPNLRFLDIYLGGNHAISVFPAWMGLPSLSTLIYSSRTLSGLPACSKLHLTGLGEFKDLLKLTSRCPKLLELRMDLSHAGRGEEWGRESSASERIENLSSMLNQRNANVEVGMVIEGFKMTNLKTLVVPFGKLGFSGRQVGRK